MKSSAQNTKRERHLKVKLSRLVEVRDEAMVSAAIKGGGGEVVAIAIGRAVDSRRTTRAALVQMRCTDREDVDTASGLAVVEVVVEEGQTGIGTETPIETESVVLKVNGGVKIVSRPKERCLHELPDPTSKQKASIEIELVNARRRFQRRPMRIPMRMSGSESGVRVPPALGDAREADLQLEARGDDQAPVLLLLLLLLLLIGSTTTEIADITRGIEMEEAIAERRRSGEIGNTTAGTEIGGMT